MNSESRPLIGVDVPWKMVEGEAFRVRKFTAYARIDGAGNVAAPPVPLPYATLEVESPAFTTRLDLPVNHRLDFQNSWDIEQGGIVPSDAVLLVSYLPYRGFMGWILRLGTPVLHLFAMTPYMADEFFKHMDRRRLARNKVRACTSFDD